MPQHFRHPRVSANIHLSEKESPIVYMGRLVVVGVYRKVYNLVDKCFNT